MHYKGVQRKVLEKAVHYLVCPFDKHKLQLNVPENQEWILEGSFQCTACKKIYSIKNGVPHFADGSMKFAWPIRASDESIIASIISSLVHRPETMAKIMALGPHFLNKLKDRRAAIDCIFNIVAEVAKQAHADDELQASMMQEATAARYDIEIYRGTFHVDEKILTNLLHANTNSNELVVEGACADGECLLEMAQRLPHAFFIGLDISQSLVEQALHNSFERANVLFIQGDITSLPLGDAVASIYVINNVLDRVVDPPQACAEANRILKREHAHLIISNCSPLQFTYKTKNGEEVVFVPPSKQLSIKAAIRLSGFSPQVEVTGKGKWHITTAAFGEEFLDFKSICGIR